MRYVMFIGIALISGFLSAAQNPSVDDNNVYHNSQGSTCGPAGQGKNGHALSQKNRDLNLLKNRLSPPAEADLDDSVSLEGMLAPGHDSNRFDSSKGATITGFVFDVKPGGFDETCNCGQHETIDRDTHVELALSENALPNQLVIVEVTPRLRVMMKDKGEDWSTEKLADPQQGIKNKWVQITGWLLFDTMHVAEAENTNPGHEGNWRATCWEIHPITAIKVLDGPPASLHQIHPELLAAFHKAHAKDVNNDPQRQKDFQDRNKELLKGFTEEEMELDLAPEQHKPLSGSR